MTIGINLKSAATAAVILTALEYANHSFGVDINGLMTTIAVGYMTGKIAQNFFADDLCNKNAVLTTGSGMAMQATVWRIFNPLSLNASSLPGVIYTAIPCAVFLALYISSPAGGLRPQTPLLALGCTLAYKALVHLPFPMISQFFPLKDML